MSSSTFEPAAGKEKRTGPRIQVRRSGVHGKGVFALGSFAKGERIVEYTGQIITWKEALRRHPHDPADPNHTFYFHIDDGRVIDGKFGGNAAKWDQPLVPAELRDRRGRRPGLDQGQARDQAGEELNYDYGLILDGRHTAKVKKEFECRCGSRKCRGTLLAPETLTLRWPRPRCTGTPRRFGRNSQRTGPASRSRSSARPDRPTPIFSIAYGSDLSQRACASPSGRAPVADDWGAIGAPSAARR
jgi:hypothetical protein